MPDFKEEQLRAIDAKGKTIVSASAGSGKTTVMIEKILRLILDEVPVEQILAMTYTKKAAAQMKEKLRDALVKKINEKELKKEKKDFLKKQLNAVHTADICTIHSFCSKLLKQNFFDGEISNTFSVISMDDAEGKALVGEALDGIFAEGYGNGDEDLNHLLSIYFHKKKDDNLREAIVKCYGTLRVRDDYKEYLAACGNDSEENFAALCQGLMENLHARCEYYLRALEREEGFFLKQTKCETSIKQATALEEYLRELLAQKNYYDCVKITERKFPSTQHRKEELPAEVLTHIERMRTLAERVKEMQSQLLSTQPYEEEYRRFASSMRTAKAIAKYILRLDEAYARLKAEKDVLDYSDLEHFALRLLKKEEVQAEMHKKYAYVFVDEYQDVNPVQEKLLSVVAGDNLFLVGDVKQSIYGFRGSKSQFFVDKERQYKEEGHNALILPQNFRCAPAVLEAVNGQFDEIMTKENTSVDYQKEGRMQTGGLYTDGEGKEAYGRVRVHMCGDDPSSEKSVIEGVYSVKKGRKKRDKLPSARIRTALDIIRREKKYGKWYDVKTKTYRDVDYGDIAVLYRESKVGSASLAAALAKENIPVTGSGSVNVCEYPEIKTLLDVLMLIDNECQDIPLCSALTSLKELTAQQLSTIRLAYKSGSFYSACRAYAEKETDALAHDLRTFFKDLKKWRLLAEVVPVGELIVKLLAKTSLETKFLSLAGGEDSMKRVHRFLEETTNPQPMSVREFLQRLKALDNKIYCPTSGGENAVKLITMHSAKGLEFPVVILFGLGEKLHDTENEAVLVDEKFGLAPFAFDLQRRVRYNTLLRRYYADMADREQIKDELNIYYVAATRAQYALHLLFDDRSYLSDPVYGTSYQNFTDFSKWEKFIYKEEFFDLPYEQRTAYAVSVDEKLVERMERALTERYAYGGLENFPVKDSASGLMKELDTPFSSAQAMQQGYFYTEREEAAGDEDKITRGLAYHAFLEKIDFACVGREDLPSYIEETLERWRRENALPQEYFAYLKKEQLCKILSLPIFAKLKGFQLYKERAFLVGLTAKEVLRLQGRSECEVVDGEAEVLFQGAIDLLAVGEEEIYLVDYKYSSGDGEYLRSHYAPQLTLYRRAVAKIMGKKEEQIKTVIVNIALGFEVPF